MESFALIMVRVPQISTKSGADFTVHTKTFDVAIELLWVGCRIQRRVPVVAAPTKDYFQNIFSQQL